MKTSNILKVGIFTTLLAISIPSFSQSNYYVVVGAFRIEKNAIAFSKSLAETGYMAKYEFHTDSKLNYVYISNDLSIDSGKEKLFELRKDHPDMDDAWLFYGNFQGTSSQEYVSSENAQVTQDNVQQAEEIAQETARAWADLEKGETKESREFVSESLKFEEEKETKNGAAEEPENEVEEEPVSVAESLEPGEFRVYINTTNAKNQREVSGKFKILDMERNKEHSTVETQQVLKIKPKNGTNRVKFVSNIFGFKMEEHLIDLDEPLKEANSRVELLGDTIMIDFELDRYKKGEFAVLWKVYFYKDAAIMREESAYELNQLLQMMQADDNMRIKIHGHTNGNSKGKVLHLDLDDKEFFTLNGSHNEDVASAKKLSEYRAYTIQHWLMDQGVPEERMEIIGWGGKKMLYDKHDDKANQNVRVEIEVLETS